MTRIILNTMHQMVYDQFKPIWKYSAWFPVRLRIKQLRMTKSQFNQLHDELGYLPHEKADAWDAIARGEFRILKYPVKIIEDQPTHHVASTLQRLLRYACCKPFRIKHWRLTTKELNTLLDSLGYSPDQKTDVWDAIARDEPFLVFGYRVRVINPDYITTALFGSGFAAIHVRWYGDMNGYDIQQTGIGRYGTRDEAIKEAKQWAAAEQIDYIE